MIIKPDDIKLTKVGMKRHPSEAKLGRKYTNRTLFKLLFLC